MNFKQFKEKIELYQKKHPYIFSFLVLYIGSLLLYIVIFHIWFADYSKPMPLNEIGDFLAGVFSPLAFLFLYLGYKQNSESIDLQNEELKASTKALELQVQEMRESVEQQKKLVEIQNNEILAKHISVRPYMEFKFDSFELEYLSEPIYDENGEYKETKYSEQGKFTLEIQNKGEAARYIKLIDLKAGAIVFQRVEIAKDKKDIDYFYLFPDELNTLKSSSFMEVEYALDFTDIYGKPYRETLKAGIRKEIGNQYKLTYQMIYD
ncbi:hypothetical protein R7J16_08205 [Acinetobacter baumannii]|uniref:hypothetical protein n=1 Tax=Acinetobacter baumannii TaxID=470 RepID=UPI000697B434|nr:hypothetical protein [Acinetobacter baumannii]MDN8285415.1 hypothetical protein [Acinetobacter baumannii]MDO7421697.1 hypothetical protein [Acinetobacter baumannii]MDW5243787.1 hypothetical protein [Acinetobacter baumannii]MDW5250176.1 hypothetical protein [Acinetobacter baumannii]MDW5253513.1 hypothetical protein [Acinetobacter baumannii]